MSVDTRPLGTYVTPARTGNDARRDLHWGLRGTIAALAAFMALTAIQGAIFVVPTMPRSVLRQGILALFPDFTVPALALGVLCGGAALVTLVTVLVQPHVGAFAAMVAGALMIGFELVEIVVVGFTPLQTPDQFPAWLQVVYLLVGGVLMILGARLWKVETGSSALRWLSLKTALH
jgi:hypothetical protein